jgi:hypothetical protein
MENTPFNPASYEAPTTGAEKPDKDNKKEKKKTSRAEAPLGDDKKQKAQRDLAQSIDKLPLFERDKETSVEKLADTLTQEEQKHVVQETAQEHLAAIKQSDAETAEELQPAAEFLQRVAEGEDTEVAFSEVASEIGLSEEEVAELMAETSPEDDTDVEADAEVAADEPEYEEFGDIDTSSDAEGVVGWRNTTSAAGGGGSTGGGTPPPPPPTPPAAGPPVGGSGGVPPSGRPNVAPTPNTLPPKAESYYQQRNKAGELLLIGLVGYLIGRRRGRIRTEKRLLPVQRKLEKQVKQLEQDITSKEQKLVAINAEKRRSETRPTLAPVERMQPGRTETRLGMEKPVRAERLGHMIIAAEAPRKTTEQAPDIKANTLRQAYRAESVPAMSRNELLELSEKIVVEGASLRRIYESHLIGEKQLRHLVSEYLQGKDIRKDLRKEMVEHEIDFERDPILRDRVRSRLANNEGGGLGEMLAKAGIVDHEADPAFDHMVQRDQERHQAAEQKHQQQRLLVDSALVTAIVLLAVVVAILALR